MNISLIDLPLEQQTHVLLDDGNVLLQNDYYCYSVLLFSYKTEFWELVWDNKDKCVILVRPVGPGILQRYLNQIHLNL